MVTLRVLVTVKAYPAVGKGGEAVCVAGIDVDRLRFIRLFPVPFRDLPRVNRFKKYETIELDARKARDPRPESYTPNTDSIHKVREALPTGKAKVRRAYIEPLLSASMCEIRRRREAEGTTLGIFRPSELLEFIVEEDRSPWEPAKQIRVDQPSMLMPGKTALEKLPFRFLYSYRCADAACDGHRQSIIDWEIGAAFRDWRDEHGSEEVAVELIRQKWAEQMWGPSRDTFFFTGNQHNNPDGFLVLGVFWPEKVAIGGSPTPLDQAFLLPPQ
jgi:hypothetical protein